MENAVDPLSPKLLVHSCDLDIEDAVDPLSPKLARPDLRATASIESADRFYSLLKSLAELHKQSMEQIKELKSANQRLHVESSMSGPGFQKPDYVAEVASECLPVELDPACRAPELIVRDQSTVNMLPTESPGKQAWQPTRQPRHSHLASLRIDTSETMCRTTSPSIRTKIASSDATNVVLPGELLESLESENSPQSPDTHVTDTDYSKITSDKDESVSPRRPERRDSKASLKMQLWRLSQGVDFEPKRTTFELHHRWEASQAKLDITQCISAMMSAEHNRPSTLSMDVMSDNSCGRLIMSPTNPRRVAWEILSMLLIIYDIITIPLHVFDYPESLFTGVMSWVSACFWTINVFMSLLCSYVHKGESIMDPRRVAMHYLKTWFAVDLAIIASDWAIALTHSARGEAHSSRIWQFVSITKLLRVPKLKKFKEKLNDLIIIDSEYTSIVMNILTMIFVMLIVNHVVSCVWFLIASLQRASQVTWLEAWGFKDVNWSHQYVVAFHWSITQCTPATMHVQPMNIVERLFTVGWITVGVLGFSYVVGFITGSLARIRAMAAERAQHFWRLKRYLKRNKVDRELSGRIQWYLDHAWEQNASNATVKDVKLFSFLSESLLSELQSFLFVPMLSVHPLFARFHELTHITARRLAHSAIDTCALARLDPLFTTGEEGMHMYIFIAGRLDYIRTISFGHARYEIVDTKEDWISEPALWVRSWSHVGSLVARMECTLLRVCPKGFGDVVPLNPVARLVALTYAKNFLAWLNDEDTESLSDIFRGSDAFTRHDEFTELGGESTGLDDGPLFLRGWTPKFSRQRTY